MIIFDELGHKSRNGIGVDGILMKILRNQETAASVGGGLPEHVKIARLFFFLPAACLSALRFFFFFSSRRLAQLPWGERWGERSRWRSPP